jgi:hypothetical protein
MRQKRNSIMKGASGALGDELVFRQRAGKTVISLPAVLGPDDPTDEQLGIRERFRNAIRYAKMVLADPALKEMYQARVTPGVSAYNLAFADHFKSPVITGIDLSNYSGSPGNTIRIGATDDFKVEAVQVSIFNAAGTVVEEGAAVVSPETGDVWIYTATAANATLAGGKVTVKASDRPGNVTTQEQPFQA